MEYPQHLLERGLATRQVAQQLNEALAALNIFRQSRSKWMGQLFGSAGFEADIYNARIRRHQILIEKAHAWSLGFTDDDVAGLPS